MGKKRPAESEAEEDGTPPATKRARVSSPEGQEEARYEAEFERLNKERVQEAISRKLRNNGAPEAGIITYIELHNFMCHKYLTFRFGPQVNFIIGHNGSGKSAALSAITIALGGRATSTGRGTGIKSFIKSGETAAEVTVTIKNGGQEPFRQDTYGEAITVTRNFTQAGSSSYKIRSKAGRVISTARDELQAILDHFSIDVDNPMNILTQDLARQFLSASNGAEKYQLFAKGTLLTQLQEEYDLIVENCNKTKAVLHHKKDVISDLEQSYTDAQSRYKQAESLQEAEANIKQIKVELAWAHVGEKEAELSKATEDALAAKSRLERIEEKIEEAQRTVAETAEKLNGVQTKANQAAAPEDLEAQFKGVQNEIRRVKGELKKAKSDNKEIAQEIRNKRRDLEDVQKAIVDANAKLATDDKRETIQRNIKTAQLAFDEAKRQHEQSVIESSRAREAQATHQADSRRVDDRHEELQRRIQELESRIADLQNIAGGKGGAAIYGRSMPKVLEAIGKTRWRDRKPIGPLGLHVKLRDQFWAPALRMGIGNVLGSFAVTNNQDGKTLKIILDNAGMHRTNIIIAQPDMFDYRSGEPHHSLLTVLRALEISDEWVTRLLINGARVERTVLARSRAEAERILSEDTRYTVWTADGIRVQKFVDGGGQTSSLGKISNAGDFRNMLFLDDREQEELERNKNTLAGLNAEYKDVYKEKTSAQELLRKADADVRTTRRTEAQCLARATELQEKLAEAKAEDVQEKSVDLTALELQQEEIERELQDKQVQLDASVQVTGGVEGQLRPLVSQSEMLRGQLGDYETKKRAVEIEVQEALNDHLQAKRSETHYTQKLEQERRQYNAKEAARAVVEEEFIQWSEQLSSKHELVENPRSVKALKKILDAQEATLQRRQEEQGKSIEELAVDLERAKDAFDKAKEEFKAMDNLVEVLRRSLTVRMQKWQHFRSFIALRCKLQFQLHLSQRGYYGQVFFNHTNGTLSLKVQTDDQKNGTGKAREKDAKMSGGEKSFSTICLLLSLWDAMGCPIRALDEFDVYMDAVNRRISMKMMLDSAKNSDKQHILITPQDMGNVPLGPEIRIHRMNDPERGQQRLAFAQ